MFMATSRIRISKCNEQVKFNKFFKTIENELLFCYISLVEGYNFG